MSKATIIPTRPRGRRLICQWCCARCRRDSQERFSRRLLAVGLRPRDSQCWRCTARLSRHPEMAGVPIELPAMEPTVTIAIEPTEVTR
jgi:hypothetical protein